MFHPIVFETGVLVTAEDTVVGHDVTISVCQDEVCSWGCPTAELPITSTHDVVVSVYARAIQGHARGCPLTKDVPVQGTVTAFWK